MSREDILIIKKNTTTSHLQVIPDYFNSIEDSFKLSSYKVRKCSNKRYKYFKQVHYTAGDLQQFFKYRNITNLDKTIFKECKKYQNINKLKKIYYGNIYDNIFTRINIKIFHRTLYYLFYEIKKCIFIQIKNNKLSVFLPFSNNYFKNNWSKYYNINSTCLSNYKKLYKTIYNRILNINYDQSKWVFNNFLVRFQYPYIENDTNVSNYKDMIEELVLNRKIPDCEFFINKRDFPLLSKYYSTPYNILLPDTSKINVLNNYPILSPVSHNDYYDIALPTSEDWVRVNKQKYFYKQKYFNYDKNNILPWNKKKDQIVFRGSSTGYGVDIDNNIRLKAAYLALKDNYINFDFKITDWNFRPRISRNKLSYINLFLDENNEIKFKSIVKPGIIMSIGNKLSTVQQANYKYILNLPGHVTAYRLSKELHYNSIIFLIDTYKYKLWYMKYLKPFQHYIPINKDLTDLHSKLNYCRNNQDICQKIISNNKIFVQKYLTKDSIFDYLQLLTINMNKHIDVPSFKSNKQINQYRLSIQKKNIKNNFFRSKFGSKYNINLDDYTKFDKILKENKNIYIVSNNYVNKFFNQDILKTMSLQTGLPTPIDKYVIKKLNCKIDNSYEYFIGTNLINQLADITHNFIYTYQYSKSNNKLYLQYIEGITFFKFINDLDFFGNISNLKQDIDNIFKIILQVIFAIEIAQNKSLFIHYDLTPWNIMIKKLTKQKLFSYKYNNNVYSFYSIYQVYIIDFDKSRFYHKEHQTYYTSINNKLFLWRPFQDIYTLSVNVIYILLKKYSCLSRKQKLSAKYVPILGSPLPSETRNYQHKLKKKLIYLTNMLNYSTIQNKFRNINDCLLFLEFTKKYSNLIYNPEIIEFTKGDKTIDIFNFIYTNYSHIFQLNLQTSITPIDNNITLLNSIYLKNIISEDKLSQTFKSKQKYNKIILYINSIINSKFLNFKIKTKYNLSINNLTLLLFYKYYTNILYKSIYIIFSNYRNTCSGSQFPIDMFNCINHLNKLYLIIIQKNKIYNYNIIKILENNDIYNRIKINIKYINYDDQYISTNYISNNLKSEQIQYKISKYNKLYSLIYLIHFFINKKICKLNIIENLIKDKLKKLIIRIIPSYKNNENMCLKTCLNIIANNNTILSILKFTNTFS